MLLPQSKEDQFINLIFGIDGIFYFVALGIDCFADCISFKPLIISKEKVLLSARNIIALLQNFLERLLSSSLPPASSLVDINLRNLVIIRLADEIINARAINTG